MKRVTTGNNYVTLSRILIAAAIGIPAALVTILNFIL